MEFLRKKYISILGASTSTFDGYSNCSLYNTTISQNVAYYPKPDWLHDSRDTWWMKIIQAFDLRLCVNNSWSGSCVTTMKDGSEKAGCMHRATELHNDVLGIEPDIIVLIIGGNDALRGYEIGTYNCVEDIYDPKKDRYIGNCAMFGQAYATMVHKVVNRYPNADVYVCSMLHWNLKRHGMGLPQYNEMIQKIAKEFRVTYVDFYSQTNISPQTADCFLHTDGVHPNQYGFAQMADCFIKLLKSKYTM